MTADDTHAAAPERTPKLRQVFAALGTLIVVVLLAVIFGAIANLPWQLEEFSQDRQALASYQIVQEGRWLYQQAPRSRTERSATKPPLIAWISAGLFAVTRSWDVAWRLPSFISAVLLATALYRVAKKRFDPATALIALSALAFNMLTPRLGTLVRTDMPLALVVFAIGVLIWQHVDSGAGWSTRDQLLIFALLTLGNYIKGPIVYAFILPGIVVYEWTRPKHGGGPAWPGWWPWIASFGLILLWVIGGIVRQPGFFDQVIMHEFLGRFNSAEQAPHPPYFYVGHLLRKFAPWLELMLILAFIAWREARVSVRQMLSRVSASTLWLCCWSLAALFLMSIVPSKRIDRIYPIIPPLCLLLGAQVRQLSARRFRWAAAAVVLSISITAYYVGYRRVYLGYHEHRDALAQFGGQVRDQALTHHWRYDAIVSHDGAILLYLGKTQFVEMADAVTRWNAGQLEAVVAETDKLATLVASCHDATVAPLQATEKADERARTYGYIVRR